MSLECKRWRVELADEGGPLVCVIEAPNQGCAIEMFLARHGMFGYDDLPRVVETTEPPNETAEDFARLFAERLTPEHFDELYRHHNWAGKVAGVVAE